MTRAGVRRGLVAARRRVAQGLARASERLADPAGPAGDASAAEAVACRFPLGHYYSPLPDSRELATEPVRSRVWPAHVRPTPGIDWNPDGQRALATDVFARQERMRFALEEGPDPADYWMANDQYPAMDAWVLEGMLRHLAPRRMIEVGSGYSSLVTARVNREHLDGAMHFTCIEPYPRRFLLDGVDGISDLRVEKVQDTPLETFAELGAGDVLFVDTAHTVKTGGDVVWIFGEILPRLAPGVVVHIHDAFIPGEYPQAWVLEGWGWNEIYLIEAFLAFNAEFEVLYGVHWMYEHEPELLEQAFPDHLSAPGRGAALWLRRRDALSGG